MSSTILHTSVSRRSLSAALGLLTVCSLALTAAPAGAQLAIPETGLPDTGLTVIGHAVTGHAVTGHTVAVASRWYRDDDLVLRHHQTDNAWFARFSFIGRQTG